MGTKRKAEDEILEIPSDDDDGSDSDVQIQEKPIPIVTVDDDDDSSTTAPSHSTPVRQPSPACGGKALDSSLGTPPPPPDISSNRSMSEEKQTMTEEKMASENLLLSMKFRDQELFHMFKGSLSEYLRTTFQLKMGGEEVDVVQQVDQFSIQVLSKSLGRITTAAILPAAENSEPVQNSNEVLLPGKECSNVKHSDAVDDAGMFVIDSTPAKTAKGGPIIPSYKKALHKVLDNSPSAAASADSATKRPKPKQNCWNCDGDHSLKDCKQPRNFVKIDKMKQAFMKTKDRYHVDLEQKYGHIVPGRMTHELRQALGLRKRDLPVHIYRMRLFGYPPGWLEDAKITHSGLQLFNSNGDPVLESDESDGEVDNVKTIKYDVRKIISFPGFNVDSGEAYIDNSKFYGVPPRMGHQSRDEMIRNLEGTLVQGYRRKKLRLDSVAQVDIDRDPADMDLDNPDESFITVDSVGDCDKLEGLVTASQCSSLPSYNGNIVGPPAMDADEPEEGEVDETEEPQNGSNQNEDEAEVGKNESTNDDSLILVEEEAEVICLDDTRADSPSLDDLRRKQTELLKQLEAQSPCIPNPPDTANDDSLLEDVLEVEKLAEEHASNEASSQAADSAVRESPRSLFPISVGIMGPPPLPVAPPPPADEPSTERPPEPEFLNLDEIKMTKVPFIDDPASMGLKKMSLGTPILTPFTPFNTLPCGEAFSKGVSDVINFENLPNSTGKYERMKSLLSKVRNVITAHNGEMDDDSR
ncbi:zinc finger CCHC domain-containing protein 8 homolog [Armigeres subalbatus]|uniref:zinc finger CCHC domain-containing protein 8 homolog n=1 Tax=Armigeres subalbatus TaxID=124917 RepID=UPI002ED54B34